jgi:Flp pilus assembly protein TadG
MSPNNSARRRGQAIVEGALVTLVLAAMLIGIFDLGLVLFIHQTFATRVRSAVRYGVVNTYDETAIKNMVLYGQPTAGASGAFGLTAAMVSVAETGVGTNDQRIVVTISGYPYRFFSPWIGGAFNGRSIMASLPLETP